MQELILRFNEILDRKFKFSMLNELKKIKAENKICIFFGDW